MKITITFDKEQIEESKTQTCKWIRCLKVGNFAKDPHEGIAWPIDEKYPFCKKCGKLMEIIP